MLNISDKIEKIRREALSPRFMQSLAKQARDLIYKRVKSGKGITDNGDSSTRLKPLSSEYILQRKGGVRYFFKDGTLRRVAKSKGFKIKKPSFGEFGTPTKSNLTFSGQMLNAMGYKSSATGSRGVFEIFIKRSRRSDSDKTNADIASYVEENGRKFMGLTLGERRILLQQLESRVKNIARNLFK